MECLMVSALEIGAEWIGSFESLAYPARAAHLIRNSISYIMLLQKDRTIGVTPHTMMRDTLFIITAK
jgi:hypothetical protein